MFVKDDFAQFSKTFNNFKIKDFDITLNKLQSIQPWQS
jgi:hypothetical protein